jgi:hypothetical protein
MTTEQWTPAPGLIGLYEVSDLGRVRSLARTVAKRNGVKQTNSGKMLAPVFVNNYPAVHLPVRDESNPLIATGRWRLWRVHTLVMAAFVGPPPKGMEVRHLNGDRSDSRLSNLAYGTRSENIYDLVKHGTHRQTRKTHCPKGHEYSGHNLIIKRGGRLCRACKYESDNRRRRRNYAAARSVTLSQPEM